MTDRMSKCGNVVSSGCIALLALFLLPGCKKQSEPAPTPNAPNRVTTPSSPNEPNVGMPMPAEMTEPNAQADAGSELRILYAGHPGSEREADFVKFLDRQFGDVETVDLTAFKESACDGFDVTILDYDGDGFDAPRVNVSPRFSQPIITMGVAGAMMGGNWGLKTGYL